jgi:hypothetical protein
MMTEGSIRNGSLGGIRLEEEGQEYDHDTTQSRKVMASGGCPIT